EGDYDDLPESAFYMVGTIEEAVGKAQKMAAEAPYSAIEPMRDGVEFELVTPERLLLSEMVEMVVVPGTEGNFGVLPGHAPLISSIRPGTIDIYEGQTVA